MWGRLFVRLRRKTSGTARKESFGIWFACNENVVIVADTFMNRAEARNENRVQGVSSIDQNLDRQLDALKAAGADKVYTEKAGGKDTTGRLLFMEVLGFARDGDTLIVSAYDRLARSAGDLLDMVDGLRERGSSSSACGRTSTIAVPRDI
jgi:hypothetical protein